MHTAATERFVQDLKAVGDTTEPSGDDEQLYAIMAELVQGLKGTGSNPTHASLIKALNHLHNFNADGLLGSHPIPPTSPPESRKVKRGSITACIS